jgi:hypothetical protein
MAGSLERVKKIIPSSKSETETTLDPEITNHRTFLTPIWTNHRRVHLDGWFRLALSMLVIASVSTNPALPCFSSNIITVFKTKRIKWMRRVSRKTGKANRIFLEKSEGKERHGRHRRSWDCNVEMNLQGIEWEGIKVSHVAQETDICAIFQRENSRLAQKLSASKEGLWSVYLVS